MKMSAAAAWFCPVLLLLLMHVLGRDANADLQTGAQWLGLGGLVLYCIETWRLRRIAQVQAGTARESLRGSVAPLVTANVERGQVLPGQVIILRNVGNGPAVHLEIIARSTGPERLVHEPRTVTVLTTGRGEAEQGWTSISAPGDPPWFNEGRADMELRYRDAAGTVYEQVLRRDLTTNDGWRIETWGPVGANRVS